MIYIYIIIVFCFLVAVVPAVVNSKWCRKNISAPFPEVHQPVCIGCKEKSCVGCKDCLFN
jgi:hypothetical protein